MDDAELKSLIGAEIQSSLGWFSADLGAQRSEAMSYYLTEPLGNEVEGRSQVVTSDVQDTIEWAMPALLKIFSGGDDAVRFEPQGPEDEESATQATDYVNWIWNRDNPGFLNFYVWFKDALLQKNGTVKIWWDEGEDWKRESYSGLPDIVFNELVASEDVEVIEHSEEAAQAIDQAGAPIEETRHSVVIKRKKEYGCVRVEPIPPEEFLISKDARMNLQDARFVGHRVRITASDLIEEGYSKELVDSLPDYLNRPASEESYTRRTTEDEVSDRIALPNKAMREIDVTECYIRVDYDGDGIAEMRKVRVAGPSHVILDNDEWMGPRPFASITPIIMPHRFYGLSVADIVKDLQLIKTTLTRAYLDGIYHSVVPREEVYTKGLLNGADDVLNHSPGAKIYKNTPEPVVTPILGNFNGAQVLEGIQYVDELKQERTGVGRYFQGLDQNALNKTASGTALLQGATQQRVELIARVFAETGVKDAFKLILYLANQHQQDKRMIRLRNQWVPMDPRQWNTEYDVSVNVGLGNGNKDQVAQQLAFLFQIDAQLIQLQGGAQGPLLTLENIHNQLEAFCRAGGLKGFDRFYSDPKTTQPPPPPPNPLAEIEAKKVQIDEFKAQSDAMAKSVDLGLKDREVRVKEFQAQVQAQTAMQPKQVEGPSEVDLAGQALDLQAKHIGNRRAQFELDQMSGTIPEGKQWEDDMKQLAESINALANAVVQMAQMQQQNHQQMLAVMTAPKRVVRDKNGKAAGVEMVMQ